MAKKMALSENGERKLKRRGVWLCALAMKGSSVAMKKGYDCQLSMSI
jgi:hypothetical protein